MVVADGHFAKVLHEALTRAIASGSDQIMPETLLKRAPFQRAMDWVAFGLMRLAIWLTGNRY